MKMMMNGKKPSIVSNDLINTNLLVYSYFKHKTNSMTKPSEITRKCHCE